MAEIKHNNEPHPTPTSYKHYYSGNSCEFPSGPLMKTAVRVEIPAFSTPQQVVFCFILSLLHSYYWTFSLEISVSKYFLMPRGSHFNFNQLEVGRSSIAWLLSCGGLIFLFFIIIFLGLFADPFNFGCLVSLSSLFFAYIIPLLSLL